MAFEQPVYLGKQQMVPRINNSSFMARSLNLLVDQLNIVRRKVIIIRHHDPSSLHCLDSHEQFSCTCN